MYVCVCVCVCVILSCCLTDYPALKDAPVNDLRYLPHDYVFTADKPAKGEVWSAGKPTPTKK